MSEMPPEGASAGGHSFLMHKFLGVPAIFWLLGTVVLAYFFFRNKSSAGTTPPPGATSGQGQESTGDITIQPPSTTIDVTAPYSNQQSSSVSQNPPRHGTPNPQPTPEPPPSSKTHTTPVKTPPKPAAPHSAAPPKPSRTVTVGKWSAKNPPWNSTLSGIAAHEHVSVTDLLKLNPQIKNPNVITPGEKIKI